MYTQYEDAIATGTSTTRLEQVACLAGIRLVYISATYELIWLVLKLSKPQTRQIYITTLRLCRW